MIRRRDFLRSSVPAAWSVRGSGACRRNRRAGAGIAHLYADLHSERFFPGTGPRSRRASGPGPSPRGRRWPRAGRSSSPTSRRPRCGWHPETKTLGWSVRRAANGLLRRVIVDFSPGTERRRDVHRCELGHGLYVARGPSRASGEQRDAGHDRPGILHVFSPDGRASGLFAETPQDTVTNCTFGGPDRRTSLRDLRPSALERADQDCRAAPAPGTGLARVIGSGVTPIKRRRVQ